MLLRCALCRAVFHGNERIAQQIAADVCQTIEQTLRIFKQFDGRFANLDNVACVHFCRHIHRRHTGLVEAVQNRPLHRAAATQTRQNRCVDIHTAQTRNVQNTLRQNFAVGNDSDHIGLKCLQFFIDRIIFKSCRLINGNFRFQCDFFDIGHFELHATIFGHVWLGIDTDDVKFG